MNRLPTVCLRSLLLTTLLLSGRLLLGATATAVARDAPPDSIAAFVCRNVLRSGEAFARTELFLGLSKPDGSQVSESAFQAFVDREVTPRFPAGLTVLAGKGQYQDARGRVIAENARILIVLYPLHDRRSQQAIEQIREVYKTSFEQESVLRVDSFACAVF